MRKDVHALTAARGTLGPDVFVVGLTWSDEGKGKVADELATGSSVAVRFHGGASAGHNIALPDGRRLHLHNLPCGVAHPRVTNVVGPMCVLDPELVETEASFLAASERHALAERLKIDHGARIVLPAHKRIDAGREGGCGRDAYGTTKTGMGPAHEDLFGRKGLTVRDIAAGPDAVRAKLRERRYYDEKRAVAAVWGITLPSLDETVDWCARHATLFSAVATDTRAFIVDARDRDLPVLWEGAHGAMIDVTNGSMPTSSLVSPWSAYHCYGPMRLGTAVVGTFRPYVTRTGPGPLPTEMNPSDASHLRRAAGEIESTTGREQRCGWLDLAAVAYAARLTGATHLCMTKMDVTPFERLRVCVGYEGVAADATLTSDVLERAKPLFVELEGWDGAAVAAAHGWRDLPDACRTFIRFVEVRLGLPMFAIGTGPVRGDVIFAGPERR